MFVLTWRRRKSLACLLPLVEFKLSNTMKLVRFIFLNTAMGLSIFAQQKTDKDLEDLRGAVHTVRTKVSYELKEAGKTVKKGRQLDDTDTNTSRNKSP